jgi:hypothetical protein
MGRWLSMNDFPLGDVLQLRVKSPAPFGQQVNALRISPDGRLIVAGVLSRSHGEPELDRRVEDKPGS